MLSYISSSAFTPGRLPLQFCDFKRTECLRHKQPALLLRMMLRDSTDAFNLIVQLQSALDTAFRAIHTCAGLQIGIEDMSEVQAALADPSLAVNIAVGPPVAELVPQDPNVSPGVRFAGRYEREARRFVFKKAHLSREDFRIFDSHPSGVGQLVCVSHHHGTNIDLYSVPQMVQEAGYILLHVEKNTKARRNICASKHHVAASVETFVTSVGAWCRKEPVFIAGPTGLEQQQPCAARAAGRDGISVPGHRCALDTPSGCPLLCIASCSHRHTGSPP